MLQSLTPEQFREWAAFERIEPDSSERLHAQITAIGGAILYQLQCLAYYLLKLFGGELDGLQQPQGPSVELLDPLAWRPKTQRRPKVVASSEAAESDFVPPSVAVSMLRGAVKG